MSENKELFKKWKATAKYSGKSAQDAEEDRKLQQSAGAFFAADEETKLKGLPAKEQLSEKYIKQFKMDVKTSGNGYANKGFRHAKSIHRSEG